MSAPRPRVPPKSHRTPESDPLDQLFTETQHLLQLGDTDSAEALLDHALACMQPRSAWRHQVGYLVLQALVWGRGGRHEAVLALLQG